MDLRGAARVGRRGGATGGVLPWWGGVPFPAWRRRCLPHRRRVPPTGSKPRPPRAVRCAPRSRASSASSARWPSARSRARRIVARARRPRGLPAAAVLRRARALRDRLAARVAEARAALAERTRREEEARALLEQMLLEPGRHRFVRSRTPTSATAAAASGTSGRASASSACSWAGGRSSCPPAARYRPREPQLMGRRSRKRSASAPAAPPQGARDRARRGRGDPAARRPAARGRRGRRPRAPVTTTPRRPPAPPTRRARPRTPPRRPGAPSRSSSCAILLRHRPDRPRVRRGGRPPRRCSSSAASSLVTARRPRAVAARALRRLPLAHDAAGRRSPRSSSPCRCCFLTAPAAGGPARRRGRRLRAARSTALRSASAVGPAGIGFRA